MRYLSLFSGIGGFEVAINQAYKNAVCVAYSEIDKHAIKEYERHYPGHRNLGDVCKLKKKDIDALGHIDLIVGGFPCNDLSSAKHSNRTGLDGEKSGLFWTMLKIIKWALKNNQNLKIVIENNASMAHKWRDMITKELTRVFKQQTYCNYFDSSQWVIQRRRRYYWTLNLIPAYTGPRLQTMKDVLLPPRLAKKRVLTPGAINYINASPSHLTTKSGKLIELVGKDCYSIKHVDYPTRLNSGGSSTKNGFIRCVDTATNTAYILDHRMCKGDNFVPRTLAKSEINKIFGFPDGYVENNTMKIYHKLYGMTVVPHVIQFILIHI